MHRGDSRFYLGRFPSRNQQEGLQWGHESSNRRKGNYDSRKANRWEEHKAKQSEPGPPEVNGPQIEDAESKSS